MAAKNNNNNLTLKDACTFQTRGKLPQTEVSFD